MSGEDQERFEDYLELERFLAELQAGHAAHLPQELTPAQARVYRMAMLFHSATPGMSEPSADFAAQLQERLERELNMAQETPPLSVPPVPVPIEQPASPRPLPLKPRPRLPRRWLLAGSVTAAASMVVGAGVEHMADMAMHRSTSQQVTVTTSGPDVVIKLDSVLEWFPVITAAELGNQAIRFRAEGQNGSLSLTGYVVRSNGTSGDPAEGYPASASGEIIAMSAVCTHKGCIVNWSSADRSFHCPCHGGVFSENGGIDTSSSSIYLNPLPRLDVRVDNGQVYVRMPAS